MSMPAEAVRRVDETTTVHVLAINIAVYIYLRVQRFNASSGRKSRIGSCAAGAAPPLVGDVLATTVVTREE